MMGVGASGGAARRRVQERENLLDGIACKEVCGTSNESEPNHSFRVPNGSVTESFRAILIIYL